MILANLVLGFTSLTLPFPTRLRVKNILREMQISPTIRARSRYSIEADQSLAIRHGVVPANVFENLSFVKFREIGFKIKVAHVLYVGGVLGSPTAGILHKISCPVFLFSLWSNFLHQW